mmetsp:Transcript_94759/g.265331  ORF Transcript_94759/g.265331 Transcript_94759/m.265331 type:complete len:175 (-) Transcript_94759:123-647(-)
MLPPLRSHEEEPPPLLFPEDSKLVEPEGEVSFAPDPRVSNTVESPQKLEVSGCRVDPPLEMQRMLQRSDSSPALDRKGKDHLQLDGSYRLREPKHNGALCWEREVRVQAEECRYLFRATDGRSWVIDSVLHDGDEDRVVIARLRSRASNPWTAMEVWAPWPSLRITQAQSDNLG